MKKPAEVIASTSSTPKIDSAETNLAGKLTRVDVKLSKFEEHEIDKRMQLEVRVATIEKHLGLDKKIAA